MVFYNIIKVSKIAKGENIQWKYIKEMTHVSTMRWPIERSFQEGKSELGMADYKHRSWQAWHRHMTYVFLAQLFMLKIRHLLKKSYSSNVTTNT